MQCFNKTIEWEVRNSEPVSVAGITLTPQARVLTLRWPGGGFVWNHPAAILVEDSGEIRRHPIPDTMLAVRIALLVMGLLSVVFMLGAMNRRKDDE